MLAGAALLNFAGSAIGALYVVYTYRELGFSPAELAVTFSFGGVAGLLGAFAAPGIFRRVGLAKAVPLCALAAGLAFFLIPAASTAPGPALLWMSSYQMVFGSVATVWAIGLITVRQLTAREGHLGRVNAFSQTALLATIPLGSISGGVAAEVFGLLPTLLTFSALASTAWLFYARPSMWADFQEPSSEGHLAPTATAATRD